jgi:hypothetical protein
LFHRVKITLNILNMNSQKITVSKNTGFNDSLSSSYFQALIFNPLLLKLSAFIVAKLVY